MKKLQQNSHIVMISTKIYIKIAFFNSKHCKQYKNTKKSFNLFLKLVKIINFLNKKWKNEIFPKILKIGTFTKTWIKFSVFKIFSPNFFYKIWMECRYEKCPKKMIFAQKLIKLWACQTCQNKKNTLYSPRNFKMWPSEIFEFETQTKLIVIFWTASHSGSKPMG